MSKKGGALKKKDVHDRKSKNAFIRQEIRRSIGSEYTAKEFGLTEARWLQLEREIQRDYGLKNFSLEKKPKDLFKRKNY